MTQKERMEQGIIYDPGASEIADEQAIYMERLWEFNQLRPSEQDKKQKYMKETFAECGEGCYIEFPLRANWGGKIRTRFLLGCKIGALNFKKLCKYLRSLDKCAPEITPA